MKLPWLKLIFTRRPVGVLLTATLLFACKETPNADVPESATPKGLRWVLIPGGSFSMGSTDWTDERPVSTVTIASFEMNRSEVTVAQYRECVEAKICSAPDSGKEYENWNEPGYEDHPVNALDWHQAKTFCRWVGGDLPSESMWEYAAKSAGKKRRFPWGDEPPSCDRAIMDDSANTDGCGTGRTWPVCSRPKGNTDQGLCDMAGNVWEWVLDWYHGTYDCEQNQDAHNCEFGGRIPSDGSPWGEKGKLIVERGGSFNSDAFYLRTSMRLRVWPTKRSYGLGFRCAR